MRFRFDIEYDGTSFSGWQKQKNAKSIQGQIIEAIEQVFKEGNSPSKLIDFQGSGRTDAGVHALGQVAHLECNTTIKPHVLKDKVNQVLPGTINILNVEKVDDRFHARHWAKSRQYIYKISKRRNVFEKKYSWWIKENLDIEKMRDCSKLLIGMHDFVSFSEKPQEEKSTQVVVENIKILETEEFIIIKIKATHFLWKMVRRIVGVLAEAGKGKLKVEDVKSFLETANPEVARLTAPAAGLFLEKVIYPETAK